jgi:hypothetical protein
MVAKEIVVARLRWQLAALHFEVKLIRLGLILHAYNPGQPRVPAGRPDGGQWTSDDNPDDPGTGDDARIFFVSDQENPRYTVILEEEEARGGHTIRRHVGKKDEELLERVQRDRGWLPGLTYSRYRDGSFDTTRDANDFVNRTLENNSSMVDSVVTGKQEDAFMTSRFGYRTGREAYRPEDSEPYIRDTYSVGVYILKDPRSSRGYRVQSAYPRNDGVYQ